MKAGEWIAKFLERKGVTDVFGIPGVVVMDFLYAVDRVDGIEPHLCYHEQGGAFEAVGYAQASGKVGVAYATRGPGLTNMITAIADAYYDSIPCIFFTAHSTLDMISEMRVMNNQEIDTIDLVDSITKYATRIDQLEDLQKEVCKSYNFAISGRRGPVVIDIYSSLFDKEVDEEFVEEPINVNHVQNGYIQNIVDCIGNKIRSSKRPVILIGNGVRNADVSIIDKIANDFGIPILSSRSSQDIFAKSRMYYGYVGSRATRYSNFILSKADLIIVLGNRLAFPINSKSFSPILKKASFIRIDADESEFNRVIPNSENFVVEVEKIVMALTSEDFSYTNSDKWISVCDKLRSELDCWDMTPIVETIIHIVELGSEAMPVVCDVGNHSFWVTTALAYAKRNNHVMYSASFGTLGCSLPKAIGAYYSTKQPVFCFAGDQGIQYNMQELLYISKYRLPIAIIILNNLSSGMIMERQKAKYGDYLLHTTLDTGFGQPDFNKIALAYGIRYHKVESDFKTYSFDFSSGPIMIEVSVEIDADLRPSLPVGCECQDLAPELPRELYEKLNEL